MLAKTFLFTSEQVNEGHPDKICDQISDKILDEILRQDRNGRVAVETACKDNHIFLLGEVSTTASVDYDAVVRGVLKDIGYDDAEHSCDYRTCVVHNHLSTQSPDIYQAVFRHDTAKTEICAGDQGIMIGYATNESKSLMPATHLLASLLAYTLTQVRKNGILPYLRPDGKTQVTVRYEENPVTKELHARFLDTVVISTMHAEDVSNEQLRRDLFRHVIMPCLKWLKDDEDVDIEIALPDKELRPLSDPALFDFNHFTTKQICHGYNGTPRSEFTKLLINPSDRFIIGGPKGDSGLTGRKVIADSYGSFGSHGGGAFSGKDPSKVDRSGAYLARHIAANLVANNICHRCMVQIGYSIGIAEPVSVFIETYGSHQDPKYESRQYLEALVRKNFGLTPGDIIDSLGLCEPKFYRTSTYGHFGRNGFSWETIKKLELP